MSDSQSVYGAKRPRPFLAASTGSSVTAPFGGLSPFGRKRMRPPHGASHVRPPRSHLTDDSRCGERQPKPNMPEEALADE